MTARRGMKRFVGLIALSALCLTLAGCGNKAGNLPPLAKVHGKVTVSGQPVAAATVEFTPDDAQGTQGPQSRGRTAEDGTFTIMTRNGKGGEVEGAVAGFHRVRIVPADSRPGADGQPSAPKPRFPMKYADPTTSGLIVEVNLDEDNVVDFELKP